MLEAPVLRTPSFQAAVHHLCSGEFYEALGRFTALRNEDANDEYSTTEIDRWIARALERLGRKEEAYGLLQNLEPKLKQFGYDLCSHYLSVVVLQRQLGKVEELQNYCRKVGGHFRTSDALGHLDWILQFAETCDDAKATTFMYTIVAVCAIQLGLDVPPQYVTGIDFRLILQRCIENRDSANRRYQAFWSELSRFTSSGGTSKQADELIEAFVQAETCPLFRDMARAADHNNGGE